MRSRTENLSFFRGPVVKTDYYYHSIGGMNPAKLVGVLEHGILSRNEAVSRELSICTQGLGCNGNDYISLGTRFGYGVNLSTGSFHFIVDYHKIETHIRPNPVTGFSGERQIYQQIPIGCILGIRLEKNSFLDINHLEVKLGVNVLNKDLMEIFVQSICDFLDGHFGYSICKEDMKKLQDLMATQSILFQLSHFESKQKAQELSSNIESLLKKHLKICYQQILRKEEITGFDILKVHSPELPIYNEDGYLITDKINDEIPAYIGNKRPEALAPLIGCASNNPANDDSFLNLSWVIAFYHILRSCLYALFFCCMTQANSDSEALNTATVHQP